MLTEFYSRVVCLMVDLAGVEPASRMPYFTTLSIQGLQQFLKLTCYDAWLHGERPVLLDCLCVELRT